MKYCSEKMKLEEYVRDLGVIIILERDFKDHHKIKIVMCKKVMSIMWENLSHRKLLYNDSNIKKPASSNKVLFSTHHPLNKTTERRN